VAAKLRLDSLQQRRHLEIRRRLHELEKHLEKHVILKRELHFRHVHEAEHGFEDVGGNLGQRDAAGVALLHMPQLKRF